MIKKKKGLMFEKKMLAHFSSPEKEREGKWNQILQVKETISFLKTSLNQRHLIETN